MDCAWDDEQLLVVALELLVGVLAHPAQGFSSNCASGRGGHEQLYPAVQGRKGDIPVHRAAVQRGCGQGLPADIHLLLRGTHQGRISLWGKMQEAGPMSCISISWTTSRNSAIRSGASSSTPAAAAWLRVRRVCFALFVLKH